MGGETGRAAAVAAAVEAADGAADRPAQGSLLPLGADVEDDGRVVDRPRGPGRPVGSRNKRTEDVRRLVLANHTHPLVHLARRWSAPVEDLARDLACTRLEAARLQDQAAKDALPYLEQRLAQEVNVKGMGAVTLILGDGGAAAGPANDGDGGVIIEGRLSPQEIAENQGVGE